jgi:pyridoxal 5-phosphate dependent beta-lyase
VTGAASTPWEVWASARPATVLIHLDSAAFGRASRATLDAVAEFARCEAVLGGYVAEEAAADELAALRRDVGRLLGSDPDGVAFVEGALAALDALVAAWPLEPGGRVDVAPSEWGPNLEVLEHHGLPVGSLPVDADGVVDVAALGPHLADRPPAVVLIDQVAAHRGLVQPVSEMVAIAHGHGVPVWVDAAQSAGHVQVPAGDAVFATSRKWLTGPRGVGMLAIAPEHRPHLRVRRAAKHPDKPPVQLLESAEAHVAGRIGLGVALREHLALGTAAVETRLLEVGSMVREAVRGLAGWEVVRPGAPAGAITALRPTAGQDVSAEAERLLREHRILTTVCLPWRAPREQRPGDTWLRISPHVDVTEADLQRLVEVLTEV